LSYQNFFYVVLGRTLSVAVSAIFFLIFATILEPTEFGEMGYLIALAGMFSVIARFGLPQTVVVYLAKQDKLLSHQINLLAVITMSAATIILLFINAFAALLCLGASFFVLYQCNLIGEKKYQRYLKNSILRNALTLIIPFPLYFVLDITGILLGMALGNIISSVWLAKSLSLKVKSFGLIKTHYKVIINNFAIDASTNLVRSVDRFFVGIVFGFLFTGIYIFNMQILFGLGILPQVLYLFLLSEVSSGKTHKKISYFVILASVLITIATIIFSPQIIELIFPKYSEGIFALQILVISLMPISISLILTAKMQATESTKVGYSAIVSIGSLLILLGFLGNEYGLVGLSVAVVISSILNVIFLYFLYRQTIRKKNTDTSYS